MDPLCSYSIISEYVVSDCGNINGHLLIKVFNFFLHIYRIQVENETLECGNPDIALQIICV